jgi:hypothetical protein
MNILKSIFPRFPTQAPRETILDQLSKTRPEVKKFTPKDLIDSTILAEIEASGFVKRLYGK